MGGRAGVCVCVFEHLCWRGQTNCLDLSALLCVCEFVCVCVCVCERWCWRGQTKCSDLSALLCVCEFVCVCVCV